MIFVLRLCRWPTSAQYALKIQGKISKLQWKKISRWFCNGNAHKKRKIFPSHDRLLFSELKGIAVSYRYQYSFVSSLRPHFFQIFISHQIQYWKFYTATINRFGGITAGIVSVIFSSFFTSPTCFWNFHFVSNTVGTGNFTPKPHCSNLIHTHHAHGVARKIQFEFLSLLEHQRNSYRWPQTIEKFRRTPLDHQITRPNYVEKIRKIALFGDGKKEAYTL